MSTHAEELRLKLKEKLENLPEKPGVYQMLDKNGGIVYVGKSKCLKNRVRSYFVPEPKWDKVNRMIPYIFDFTYIVTDTHLEARLRECEMIKRIRPFFNVMMKEDHRYVYLKLREYNTSNPLGTSYVREADTYGLYRSRSRLEEALLDLRKLYPFEKTRGCCAAEEHLFPVTMDREAFQTNRSILRGLLENTRALERFICVMERKMQEAAKEYRFETAGKYKEHIDQLRYIKKGLDGYEDSIEKRYLLKLPVEEAYKLFYIEKGFLIWKQKYPQLTREAEAEFLGQAKQRAEERREELEQRCLEKGCQDFREIIFTEIMSLPGEMVSVLKNGKDNTK